MSILKKASTQAANESRSRAVALLHQITEALSFLKSLEVAPQTFSDIVKKSASNTTVSGGDMEVIGIQAIEVDHKGNIVQVQRSVE